MKKGWTYKKFKEVSTSITDGDWIEKKDQSLSGIRLVQTGNIGIGEFIPKDDSHKYISEDTFNRLKCTEIFEGDILISRLPNPLGRSCILPKLESRCITAVDCTILRLKRDEVLPKFFLYYTQSQGYFSKIDAESSGTTRARITRKKLEETAIPIPSLKEQKRIVKRLDAAFAQIDELKANAEKQLAEARALFQKSLAKAMEPKEGWEEKKLGDVCEIKSLLVDPTKEQYKKLLHVGGANIVSMTGELVDLKTAEDEQLTSGKFTFDINDVLYNKIRPYLIKVARPNFNGLCSADMYPLTPKESITRGYLYYVLISKDFTEYAILNSGRAGMPKVNRQALFAYKCSIPSIKEQQRIVERLDSINENVRKYEEIQQKIIAECDALKQALLRQVFE